MKLSEVAQKLACRLEGAPDTEIRGIAGIEHAEPGQITFLANRRYFPLLKTTRASAVLIEDGIRIDRATRSSPIPPSLSHMPSTFFISPRVTRLAFPRPRSLPRAHVSAMARTLGLTVSSTM